MPKQGGNTGSMEYAPGKVEAIRAAQARQEARWARMAGPVTVTWLSPEELAERKRERRSRRSRRG
jgi:hypothetical protein